MNKLSIISDTNSKSLKLKKQIIKIFNKEKIKKTNIIIVIGGDGFMLKTLKKNKNSKKSFYGINSGNYGFLMNKFSSKLIVKNLSRAKTVNISPLEMSVNTKNHIKKSIAINEVSILRQSRQAANLSIKNNSKHIIKKLVSDGVLVSTPAGSTAYNLSVHGPILNLNSKKISIAPISAFRPRRWKGKIVSNKSTIVIRNLNPRKRPVSAVADNFEVRHVKVAKVSVKPNITFNLLFDRDKSLQKKAEYCTKQEYNAVKAERESIKFMQIKFMQNEVGNTFNGIISGVSDWGLYVELDANKCEGMVHVKDIEDDKYLYNTDEQMLIGRATNKKFQLGDKITIKVKKADLIKKHLDFTII